MNSRTAQPAAALATLLPPLEWERGDTRFVLFTGKGGVGKTTIASGVAVALADAGRGRIGRVLADR